MSPFVLVLALLDLCAVNPVPGLRIEAQMFGDRVGARLVNESHTPIRVFTGMRCSGPNPFKVLIDGVEHPFAPRSPCSADEELTETLYGSLEPLEMMSTVFLNGQRRTVQVSYTACGTGKWWPNKVVLSPHDWWTGRIVSAPLDVPARAPGPMRVTLRAPSNPAVRDGFLAEILHENVGGVPLKVVTGYCYGDDVVDYLLVDGRQIPIVPAAACDKKTERTETLSPGGSFVTPVLLWPAAESHRLQVVYHVPQSSNGGWIGMATTAEQSVKARR